VVRTRSHHDVFGHVSLLPDTYQVTVSLVSQRIDVPTEAHGQIELPSVLLEVVGRLVLGGEVAARSRQGHAGQAAQGSRGEQPQGVPASPPSVSDPISGVEDHEVSLLLFEVVTHGEP
jgi:hypothetical protein